MEDGKMHLTNYIPEGNLNVYKAIYNRISTMDNKQYYLSSKKKQSRIENAQNVIDKVCQQLEDIFTHDEIIRQIRQYIWKAYQFDNPRNLAGTMAEIYLKQKRDEALDILVHCLMADCKIYSNRYRWKCVMDYLEDNKFIETTKRDDEKNSFYDFDVIKKRYERLDDEDFEDLLSIYHAFCSHENPLIPAELAEHYNEKGILKKLKDSPFRIALINNPFALKGWYTKV